MFGLPASTLLIINWWAAMMTLSAWLALLLLGYHMALAVWIILEIGMKVWQAPRMLARAREYREQGH